MKKSFVRSIMMLLCFTMLLSSGISSVSAATKYTYNSTQLTQLDNAFKKHGWVIKQGFWANTKAVVKPVQTMLKELGYGSLSVDGVFGSATKKAVINFQGKNKLTKDGCVGTGTWNKLVSVYRSAISKNTSSSAAKAKTTISFESISNPGTIQQGNGTHLSGTIKSSNSKLSNVTASVLNSSGKTVLSKSVNPNAYSYKLYDSAVDWAMSFGKLSAGSYTLKYTAKTADGTSNSKSVNFTVKAKETPAQNTSSKSSASTSAVNSAGYSVEKALQFAKQHAYTDTNWLCAEYVSRCLKAGGLKSDVFPGVGDLYRALEKTTGVTKYTLIVESNGKILPKKNQGKIASGDVIIMRHKGEPDSKEYIHAVIVGDLNNNGIKVYAHNSAYSNEVYDGFNHCGYCNTQSSNVIAYGFHFEQ